MTQPLNLTADQQNLIRHTFISLGSDLHSLGRTFYRRVFELAPDLPALFDINWDEQARRFIGMMSVAIGWFDRPDQIAEEFRALGHRHRNYRVAPEHFVIYRSAWLHALEVHLGDRFTAEAGEAWVTMYNWIMGMAIEAMTRTNVA